ncbi:MAG: ATP-grasp domain-containing protein, partial [Roseimicrobium sp.]
MDDTQPFTHAYLEEQGNGRLGQEEKLLRSELDRQGIPVTLYTAKRMLRRQLPLGRTCFVAGDMTAMHGAMRQLGIEPPVPNDYPECLRSYLHRKVWTSTLAAVEKRVHEGDGPPVFAKPSARRKSFTGRVFASPNDLYAVAGTSRREPVWCSEVVEWVSEYRVYVLGET